MKRLPARPCSSSSLRFRRACPGARRARHAHARGEGGRARSITPDLLRAHVRFLSDDLLEGRGPASRGDRWPSGTSPPDGGARASSPARPAAAGSSPSTSSGITSTSPDVVTFRKGARQPSTCKPTRTSSRSPASRRRRGPKLDDAEVVFVGYGIVAPEYEWDDYKGADLKGKVLLMMNNDPEDDPALFAGKTRL